MKRNRKEKRKGREFLRRKKDRQIGTCFQRERAFETDVESFDNMHKERGRRDGIRDKATGRRVTEEYRGQNAQYGTRQEADRYGPG